MAGLTDTETRIAGIELGGTKCIATLARGRTILHQNRWPTLGTETLDQISAQLDIWHKETPFAAIGIGSFGPLCLAHQQYGDRKDGHHRDHHATDERPL